jgi:hydroxymethylglutaryl-CoA lyase
VLRNAKTTMLPVRGYVSCVTDCPFDGPVAPEAVAQLAEALIGLGCYQVSLGDTLGSATPASAGKMLEAVLARLPASRLAGHFHDTKGQALHNIALCLDLGLRTFDSSVGGLGGCPYAPGAQGNVATEAVVTMLHDQGFETGIDVEALADMSRFAQSLRRRE